MLKKTIILTLLAGAVWAGAANSQEVYVKAGFLGAGAGVAHSLNERFGLRADLTTIGSTNRDRTSNNLDYKAKLKADQASAYADWFPFGNGFRLSAGVQLRRLSLSGHGVADEAGTVTINETRIPYGPGDDVSAKLMFPKIAPYLGLGWGHNPSAKGWGFVFDLGVALGRPKAVVHVSDGVYARLDAAARLAGTTADAEIAAQRDRIARNAEDFKVFPQLYLGVSYRF